MTLDNTSVGFSVAGTLNNPLTLGVVATAALSMSQSYALTTGTAAGQADKIYAATRTITASSNDDLDLAGVLVDALGATITFARVKALVIRAAATNVNNLILGGSASNPVTTILGGTTPTLTIRPGGGLCLFSGTDATGYVITASTADILRLTNGGAGSSVTYDIVIIGASA